MNREMCRVDCNAHHGIDVFYVHSSLSSDAKRTKLHNLCTAMDVERKHIRDSVAGLHARNESGFVPLFRCLLDPLEQCEQTWSKWREREEMRARKRQQASAGAGTAQAAGAAMDGGVDNASNGAAAGVRSAPSSDAMEIEEPVRTNKRVKVENV